MSFRLCRCSWSFTRLDATCSARAAEVSGPRAETTVFRAATSASDGLHDDRTRARFRAQLNDLRQLYALLDSIIVGADHFDLYLYEVCRLPSIRCLQTLIAVVLRRKTDQQLGFFATVP